MNKNTKEKVVAIIPTHNEESNVANVLKTIIDSTYFDEIIVVDGASTDKTIKECEKLGVKIIKLAKKGGKGNDMKEAVKRTSADIIVFFDADIIGLKKQHINNLVQPIIKKQAGMSVGVRERGWNLPWVIIKLDFLLALGGERALRREIFESLPEELIQGFAIESTLNYYCSINKIPVKYVHLEGVSIIIKEKKWGIIKGFKARLKEIYELIGIRFLLRVWRKKMMIKNAI